ncbi:thioredoxin-like domain-containing protein [Hoylesella pleuritidis]|jgi:AhpC/TSA family.|uniref:PF14289 domain protein n=1 Tax=Hoylesella pleuritidis F0068 TaxID=1081904 RepID=U2KQC9_9BACT|nr:thioredoxin-like domain-containing protein [Hoylesella pleuritidis]ERK00687.1 PF14289 domain protein [Hoylesella pleuritidis F0068]
MRMKKTFTRVFSIALLVVAVLNFTACNKQKFNVNGTISEAKDSILYFENMSLNGPEVVDSVRLNADGVFHFSAKATGSPEFYRLRIAGQIINVAADSTENITIKAVFPTMSDGYEVSGSEECSKIKELALMQMRLQTQIDAIAKSPDLGVDAVEDSVAKVLDVYKNNVKLNYIFKQPMKAYAYFALFQTVILGDANVLIFNPRSSSADVKVFAAVATSWDTYYPQSLRGENLHNIAIAGMKNVRIIHNEAARSIDADKVDVSGLIDIALRDNKGRLRRLKELKGRVVMLDFHLFAGEGSLKRIMMLRDLYNKYHAMGFEIYQVSVDPDEHFWKQQTAALPWISVRDEAGVRSSNLVSYNVQSLPTFFLIDRNNVLQKRDAQIKDLDATLRAMLK